MATQNNIDLEWEKFLSSSKYDDNSMCDSDETSSNDVMDEHSYTNEDQFPFTELENNIVTADISNEFDTELPISTPIYISTKTKISYLNQQVDLKEIFWKIPIIPYVKPVTGVVKKQIKLNSLCQEELDDIQEKLKSEKYYDEHIMTSINNPSGRIKFRDIRKISIGVSRKDIMSYRSKKKSAFYNCFVLILRMKVNNEFKEFHVKVFNTGKLEIPGIQTEETFQKTLSLVIEILQPYFSEKLEYQENTTETVLINSNFNCGFYINREALFDILKYKYNIQAIYDPCSYPGIQCKFYYNPHCGIQTGVRITPKPEDSESCTNPNPELDVAKPKNKIKQKKINEVSFMIFRTGSILIVGKCDENVLYIIYEFLKKLLLNEYSKIGQQKINIEAIANKDKDKKKKIQKKIVITSVT